MRAQNMHAHKHAHTEPSHKSLSPSHALLPLPVEQNVTFVFCSNAAQTCETELTGVSRQDRYLRCVIMFSLRSKSSERLTHCSRRCFLTEAQCYCCSTVITDEKVKQKLKGSDELRCELTRRCYEVYVCVLSSRDYT